MSLEFDRDNIIIIIVHGVKAKNMHKEWSIPEYIEIKSRATEYPLDAMLLNPMFTLAYNQQATYYSDRPKFNLHLTAHCTQMVANQYGVRWALHICPIGRLTLNLYKIILWSILP